MASAFPAAATTAAPLKTTGSSTAVAADAADSSAAASAAAGASSFAAGARSIIVADIHHVASACGYGVPLMDFKSDRDSWVSWAGSKDESALQQYRIDHNAASLDGLDALQAAIDAASGAKAAGDGKGKAAGGMFGAKGAAGCSSCMAGLLQKVVGEAAAEPVMWLALGLSAGVLIGVHAARH
jgi:hypothetical protein